MDRIIISGLEAKAIIGTLPDERTRKQKLVIDLDLHCDLSRAGRSDDLNDTIDYSAVEKAVAAHVEASSFKLLEALAESVAGICLGFKGVEKAVVKIQKPSAQHLAHGVAIEISRSAR